MGCYCREISIMSSDISTIGSCISSLNSIKTSSEEIVESVEKAADNLEDNIDITNKEGVISALKNLCKDEPGDIGKTIESWQSFKESLQNRLDSMKESDRHYHEEQRRKHSHSKG